MAQTASRSEPRYGNRPTMKDVAARAGVGLKTVSRVVNGEAGVTPDTERRVQEAIEALGFRRNDSARVLRKGRTASIGLVLEDLADPFYGPLNRAVEEVARAHGALLINGSSAEDPEREQELVLALCARRVDGLIVIPAGDDHRYLEPEIAAGVATVFVDRPAGKIDADMVFSDNFGGARDGVAHLIAGATAGSASSVTSRASTRPPSACAATTRPWRTAVSMWTTPGSRSASRRPNGCVPRWRRCWTGPLRSPRSSRETTG